MQRHRGWGLAQPWLEQVPAFRASVDLDPGEAAAGEAPVLLHTEVMPANLLAARDDDGRWQLCGLGDLEPATCRQGEYELVAVAILLAQGDAAVLSAALSRDGYAPGKLDQASRRRMMAWTLLHRYGNLASYLERLPAPAEPTFAALADRWFATNAAGWTRPRS